MLSVKRLRLADGEPMAIELLHVPGGARSRPHRARPRGELLLRPARARYAIEIVGGTQTVEPTVTNEEESASLGVPLHSPALLFERVTRSAAGEIVEFASSIYRGDRYRLVSELGLGGRPPRPVALEPRGSFA